MLGVRVVLRWKRSLPVADYTRKEISLENSTPHANGNRTGLSLLPPTELEASHTLTSVSTRQSAASAAVSGEPAVHVTDPGEGMVRIAKARRTQHMYTEALHAVPPGTLLLEFDGGATRRLPRVGYGSFRSVLNGREVCHGSRVEFGIVESSIEAEALALCTGLYQTWLHLSVRGYEPSRIDVIVRGDCVDLVDALNAGDKRLASRTRAGFVTGAAVYHSVRGEWHGRENSVARFAH